MAIEKKTKAKKPQATKHAGGRPPMHSDAAGLQELVDAYFKSCEPEIQYAEDEQGHRIIATDRNGKPVIIFHAATMSGLAHYLGFTSRQSLYDYKNKSDEFAYIIKRARLKLEAYAEEQLYLGNKPVGAIFALKNMGWTDKQEIEHSGTVQIIDDIPKNAKTK